MLYAIYSEHKCFGDMRCCVQCTQTRAPSKTCHCPCMPLSWGRGSFCIQFQFQPPLPCSEYFWKLFAESQRWLNSQFMESRRLNQQRINRLKDQKIKTKQNLQNCETFVFEGEPTKQDSKIILVTLHQIHEREKMPWIPIVHAKRCGFNFSLHL